jgi:hypothetical protein
MRRDETPLQTPSPGCRWLHPSAWAPTPRQDDFAARFSVLAGMR